jgi:hypothetical protein
MLSGVHRYLWLERGVYKRGGSAPSQIVSPSQTMDHIEQQLIYLFERGSGGEFRKFTTCIWD